MTSSPPNGQLTFEICVVLTEYERALIRRRTLDGLAAAQARGKHFGRKEALN